MVDRVKLDSADALIGADRRVPGLDVERFGIDLRSARDRRGLRGRHGARRAAAREGERRVPFPSFSLRGEDGEVHWVYDSGDPEQLRAAALGAGAVSGPLPGALEAVARFGRIATPEVAAVCERPGPLAAAELCGGWPPSGRCGPSARSPGVLWSPA